MSWCQRSEPSHSLPANTRTTSMVLTQKNHGVKVRADQLAQVQ